jgi:hypothetical protein
MTALFGSGACRLGGLTAIYWASFLWLKDSVDRLTMIYPEEFRKKDMHHKRSENTILILTRWTRPDCIIPVLNNPFDWDRYSHARNSPIRCLFFDIVLLAAVAVAFSRSRTTLGRVLSLEAAVLILVVKWLLGGGYPSFDEPLQVLYFWFLFIIIYFGFMLLPAMIGLLRQGVDALSSR